MEIWKIKKITILIWASTKEYEVWINDITEIKDNWIEYDDSIHFIYIIKDNWENIVAQVENCPVIIEYKTK